MEAQRINKGLYTQWTYYQMPNSHQICLTKIKDYHFITCYTESESEVAQSCPTLRPHELQPIRLLHP